MAFKRPVVLRAPVPMDGRFVYMVQPTEFQRNQDGSAELSFRVVDARMLQGCEMRSNSINVLVVEFPHGQFEFTKDGVRPSKYTTEGAGVDPAVVEQSRSALCGLVEKSPSHPIVLRVIQHLSEKFGKDSKQEKAL